MNEQPVGLPEYLLKECEFLRTRLTTNINETATLERYAIAVTGALWAWICTHKLSSAPLLNWLPLILTLFLGIRSIAVYLRIKSIRVYLAKLETAANVPDGLGWIAAQEAKGARYRLVTANIFWWGINLVNLILAIISPALLLPLVGSTR